MHERVYGSYAIPILAALICCMHVHCPLMHQVQLTVDDGWHGQHYPVPVIDDWPYGLVSDDWQVGPQMAVTL